MLLLYIILSVSNSRCEGLPRNTILEVCFCFFFYTHWGNSERAVTQTLEKSFKTVNLVAFAHTSEMKEIIGNLCQVHRFLPWKNWPVYVATYEKGTILVYRTNAVKEEMLPWWNERSIVFLHYSAKANQAKSLRGWNWFWTALPLWN